MVWFVGDHLADYIAAAADRLVTNAKVRALSCWRAPRRAAKPSPIWSTKTPRSRFMCWWRATDIEGAMDKALAKWGASDHRRLCAGRRAAGQFVRRVAPLTGAIGPATTSFITRAIEEADEAGAPALIIEMDTPGGLDSATRDINQAILSADVPVVVYVSPPGARAASAGAFITYASHVAAMAPGTSIGAATPVQMGGGGSDPASPPTPEGTDPAVEEAAGEAEGDKRRSRHAARRSRGSAGQHPGDAQ
jgi:hypothetical protein